MSDTSTYQLVFTQRHRELMACATQIRLARQTPIAERGGPSAWAARLASVRLPRPAGVRPVCCAPAACC
jgi:hypothetical protein